jgi:hypothetical protein
VFAAGESKDGKGAITASAAEMSPQQRIERWVQLVEQNAPVEQIQQAEKEVAEALKKTPFELRQQLPFFQRLVKKLDSTGVFQHFRLPGRDRLVADRRDQPHGEPTKEGAKGEKAHGGRHLHLKEGKLVEQRQRTYVNYLGGREEMHRGSDQAAAGKRVEQMLTKFEKVILQRFEGGKQIAGSSPDGKPHFLPKTDKQWRDFFRTFLDRTVQKKVLASEIREFLMRGVVQKGSKGVFIGDMQLASGRVEKFVRFAILAEALAKLKTLMPGDAVSKATVGEIAGEELMYLALAASRGRDFLASMLPTRGRFMGERAESQAAEALGLPLDMHLRARAQDLRGVRRGRGKGLGLFGGDLIGGEPQPDDIPYQFIPWWKWGNLARPGKFRWVTAVFYGSLLFMALLGIGMMTWRILKGV